jgi:hypothetical protein
MRKMLLSTVFFFPQHNRSAFGTHSVDQVMEKILLEGEILGHIRRPNRHN